MVFTSGPNYSSLWSARPENFVPDFYLLACLDQNFLKELENLSQLDWTELYCLYNDSTTQTFIWRDYFLILQ